MSESSEPRPRRRLRARLARGVRSEPESNDVLIVGGGLVGATLAERLARDGYDVTLVESERERVEDLENRLEDVQVIEGHGATGPVLRRAGIERASLVVAVTDSDESNLLVGYLAASYGVPRVIARVRDRDHQRCIDFLREVGRPDYVSVNPNQVAADRIARLLEVPGANDVVSFLGGELLLVGFRIPERSDLAALLVRNVDLMFAGTPTLVAAIRRGGEWIIPGGDDELRAGDVAYFASTREDLPDLLALLGERPEGERSPKVIVAGATPVGVDLAARLEGSSGTGGAEARARSAREPVRGGGRGWRVVLIEENRERAERAHERLRETVVVHGSPTDQELLEEEEVEQAASFVAATSDHETNLVAALLARRLGARRTFALVDNPSVANLVADIGIDAPIVPRQLVIDMVLGYVRGRHVLSVATLLQEGMEAFEGEVTAESVLCSGPIHRIASHLRGSLVLGVQRGERLHVPRGSFAIEPGDHVVLITTKESGERIGKLLGS